MPGFWSMILECLGFVVFTYLFAGLIVFLVVTYVESEKGDK